jgi:hypothetical protein
MALVNTVVPSSAIPGKFQSYADYLPLLTTEETYLLDRIGFNSLKKACIDSTDYYPQRILTPKRTTLATTITNSGTTIIMTDACFVAGEEVAMESEVITLGTTSDNLTFTSCTRHTSYYVAHTAGCVVNGLGVPQKEGFAGGVLSSPFQEISTVTTYPRLFSRDVYVTNTSAVIGQHGVPGGKLADVMHDAIISIKKEMNNAILFSDAVAPSGVATAGKFDGLFPRARAASLNASLSSLAMTRDDLSTGVRALRNRGHRPNALLISMYSHRVLNSLYEAQQIFTIEAAGQLGGHARAVDVDGAILEIISHPDLNSQAVVADLRDMEFGPLTGPGGTMELNYREMGVGGSRQQGFMEGQYTFRCPGPGAYVLTEVKNS